MKNSYKIRAIRFIEKLYPYIENCDDMWDYRKALAHFKYDNPHRNIRFAYGISRVAFITSDYVVKIDYDPEEIDRIGGGNSEEQFYAFAKQRGYAHLLAEVSSFAYGTKVFYVMPRINGIGKYEDDVQWFLNEDDRDFVDDYLFDMHNLNYGWKNGYPVIVDYACNVLTCS